MIINGLQLLLKRNCEWNDRCPIYTVNADALSVFDYMQPDIVIDSLLDAGYEEGDVVALMREGCDLTVEASFVDVDMEGVKPIGFNRCERQGSLCSGFKWNAVMPFIFSKLVPIWYQSGFGVDIFGKRITHLIFADNCWLISHSHEHVECMLGSLARVHQQSRLYLKPSSLEIMSSL